MHAVKDLFGVTPGSMQHYQCEVETPDRTLEVQGYKKGHTTANGRKQLLLCGPEIQLIYSKALKSGELIAGGTSVALKTYNPTTPGQRYRSSLSYSDRVEG